MDKMQLLQQIFQTCIIPLLGILTAYAIKCIKAKGNEIAVSTNNALSEKYIKMLTDTITECVQATNQTYVNTLKDKNAFTAEAQKEAFKKSSESVMIILSQEAKEYLESIYGDLNAEIMTRIEAQVGIEKKPVKEKTE